MGFKDTDWAYGLELAMAEKNVLIAICHRTNDKTHETFVGQKTIAEMASMSVRTVGRSIGVLVEKGIVMTQERRREDGYRTSNRIVLNRDWGATHTKESQVTESHVTQSQVTDSPTSSDTVSKLTGQSDVAIRTTFLDHSEGHSGDHSDMRSLSVARDLFAEFYAIWPRKRDRPAAQRAWTKAIKLKPADEIIAAAIAYRDNPHRPEPQLIPYPATWLNGHRWNDELDGPRENRSQDRAPTRNERNLALVADIARQAASTQRGISA